MKLEIGYKANFEIRYEELHNDEFDNIAIMYLSDFHLNRFSNNLVINLISSIKELNPDIILLGGDYVDFSSGKVHLEFILDFLSTRKNVYAIPGNHDYFFGIKSIEKLFKQFNINWLDDTSVEFVLFNTRIFLTNSIEKIPENFKGIKILCLHKPIDYKSLKFSYDLIFAGHLHGCQFVFWQNKYGLFPGRFFYRLNRLKIHFENTLYIISKGLGDTLPIRYNCKKEIIIVSTKRIKK